MFQCILFGVLVLAAVIFAQKQDYCYSHDNEHPQYAHMSSKTIYSYVKGPENGQQFIVPNCKPTKIWMFLRHGTRFTSASATTRLRSLDVLRDEIIANYEKQHPMVGAMCEDDLNLLKQWHWNPNAIEEHPEYLTSEGYEELKQIAKRYQRAFPNILLDKYDSDHFYFGYPDCQRTEESYKAFVEGLFGPNADKMINVPCTKSKDLLFKPHRMCKPFDNFESKAENTEYGKFVKSPTIIRLINDVSRRLGYKFPLKLKQILNLYETCRFDLAWNLDKPSPWCAAFTPAQIYDIEYLLDLETFYAKSYGRKQAPRIACALADDMTRHLDSNTNPKSIQYFAHSSSLIVLLTALHADEDTVFIRADNYHNMTQRLWNMSKMAPFAANLAAVKYDCPNDKLAREKVKFFLNENPLELSWCNAGVCNFQEMKELLKEYTENNCNEYFCSGYDS